MNIELLKKEVLQTICQYIEAKEEKNLNIEYCCDNYIQAGLCAYCHAYELDYLAKCIFKFSKKNCHYMCPTPYQVHYMKVYKYYNEDKYLNITDCHNKRIIYLTKILQEILYIEQMKQEGKIYTYYNLISLFKF